MPVSEVWRDIGITHSFGSSWLSFSLDWKSSSTILSTLGGFAPKGRNVYYKGVSIPLPTPLIEVEVKDEGEKLIRHLLLNILPPEQVTLKVQFDEDLIHIMVKLGTAEPEGMCALLE